MDQAHQDVARTGSSIQTAFANRLAERGLITTDPELGEPFEHIKPGSRAAGVDQGQGAGYEPTAQVRALAR